MSSKKNPPRVDVTAYDWQEGEASLAPTPPAWKAGFPLWWSGAEPQSGLKLSLASPQQKAYQAEGQGENISAELFNSLKIIYICVQTTCWLELILNCSLKGGPPFRTYTLQHLVTIKLELQYQQNRKSLHFFICYNFTFLTNPTFSVLN